LKTSKRETRLKTDSSCGAFYYLFFKELLKKIIIQDKKNPINNPIKKKAYEEIALISSATPLSNMGL
jgi:hypothetical protein